MARNKFQKLEDSRWVESVGSQQNSSIIFKFVDIDVMFNNSGFKNKYFFQNAGFSKKLCYKKENLHFM